MSHLEIGRLAIKCSIKRPVLHSAPTGRVTDAQNQALQTQSLLAAPLLDLLPLETTAVILCRPSSNRDGGLTTMYTTSDLRMHDMVFIDNQNGVCLQAAGERDLV